MTTTTWTFFYTGSPQTFVVPFYTPGTLTFRLSGGTGGTNGLRSTAFEAGGTGGWIRGALTASPGTVLTVDLGGTGQNGYYAAAGVDWPHAAGGAGPRPGGQGGTYGSHSYDSTTIARRCSGGGGGGSELYQGATLIAVAGGGSGGALHAGTGSSTAYHGAQQTGSGAQSGSASTANPAGYSGNGGLAGTTSAAGAGGGASANKYPTYVTNGYDGSGGTGGAGGDMIYVPGSPASGSSCGGGSGGGGGYYGGGGGGSANLLGAAGTGGAGSSWSHTSYVTEGSGPLGAASTLVIVADYLGDWVPPAGGWSVGFLKF